jgi:hypothetical protein
MHIGVKSKRAVGTFISNPLSVKERDLLSYSSSSAAWVLCSPSLNQSKGIARLWDLSLLGIKIGILVVVFLSFQHLFHSFKQIWLAFCSTIMVVKRCMSHDYFPGLLKSINKTKYFLPNTLIQYAPQQSKLFIRTTLKQRKHTVTNSTPSSGRSNWTRHLLRSTVKMLPSWIWPVLGCLAITRWPTVRGRAKSTGNPSRSPARSSW